MKNKPLLEKLNKLKHQGFISELSESILFNDEPRIPQWYCIINPKSNGGITYNGSAIGFDEDTVKIKAMGEAIERYCCSNFNSKDITIASYEELNYKALDPLIFINYSNEVLKNKKDGYIEKIRKSKLSWVLGQNLETKEDIFIPTQLVYSEYFNLNEPLIRIPISTGAAFEQSYEKAVERGLLEIIERDCFMLNWLSKNSPSKINLNFKGLKNLKDYFLRYKIEPYIFDITNDLEIPSMLCLLIDRTGVSPAVSAGLKSDLNPYNASIGSLLEAQHGRNWTRFSYSLDGKPDINNPSEIIDFKTRGYFWFKDDMIKNIEFLLSNNKVRSIEDNDKQNDLNYIKGLLKSKGYNIFTVNLTSKVLDDYGLFVIKTIVPELHPLSFSYEMPYDFSNRLNKTLNRKKPNLYPHPFT